MSIDATHDPALRSWVESANAGDTEFPVQNLPFGVFQRGDVPNEWRHGVAIGEMVLDLVEATRLDVLREMGSGHFRGSLNRTMTWPSDIRDFFRREMSTLLRADTPQGEAAARHGQRLLVRQADVTMRVPADIGDYTDFYASAFHATNVGSMFRPDNPLLPNYKWVPIGYHGRASSIVVSGTMIRRPMGQASAKPEGPPTFGPSRRLDYEVELGGWICGRNDLGARESIETAADRLFGLSLLNDWSARDVQAWEYQPLGPFLAKNFATTVSPWVVTTAALAPFRAAAFQRAEGDPAPLEYLTNGADQALGAFDITIECSIRSERMRNERVAPMRLSTGNARDLYWTFAQMIAHHASNGCNLQPGDLLGSGTVSGSARESRGCLLELSWRGNDPVTLPTGETRAFLEDGDEVTFRARASREGFRTIGFGECTGIVLPAIA